MYDEEDDYINRNGRQNNFQQRNNRAAPNNGQPSVGQPGQAASGNESSYQPRCIAPNPERRAENQRIAQAEAEEYNAYQQANRLTYVSEVGTVGGGAISLEEIRLQQQRDTDRSRIQKPKMKSQWKQDERRREDEENTKKKLEARKKAEQNEERRKKEEREMKEKHEKSHKLANEEFLSRLERQSFSSSMSHPPLNSSSFEGAAATQQTSEASDISHRSSELSTREDMATARVSAGPSEINNCLNMNTAASPTELSLPTEQSQRLSVMFPNVSMDIIEDVLKDFNYDIEQAAEFLLFESR